MRGSISKRGKRSWRLKFDLPRGVDGKRQTRVVTVRGTKKEAEAELARLLHEVHRHTFVDPDKITVGQWLHRWQAGLKLTARSAESYAVIVARLECAIGAIPLQKLRPIHVREMRFTKKDGTPVSAGTDRQARRVLKAALGVAVEIELVQRNVGASGSRVVAEEEVADIPGPAEITAILETVRETDIFPIVHLALSTGARRGELLALRWSDVDLEANVICIERNL